MAAAGYAILGTGALRHGTGWLTYVSAALCAVAIPSMYVGVVDHTGFYNAAGWGPLLWRTLRRSCGSLW